MHRCEQSFYCDWKIGVRDLRNECRNVSHERHPWISYVTLNFLHWLKKNDCKNNFDVKRKKVDYKTVNRVCKRCQIYLLG